MADNGNYIEPEEIAVRHGVCGDPRQVRNSNTLRLLSEKKPRYYKVK